MSSLVYVFHAGQHKHEHKHEHKHLCTDRESPCAYASTSYFKMLVNFVIVSFVCVIICPECFFSSKEFFEISKCNVM